MGRAERLEINEHSVPALLIKYPSSAISIWCPTSRSVVAKRTWVNLCLRSIPLDRGAQTAINFKNKSAG